jgi:hypothetical protein
MSDPIDYIGLPHKDNYIFCFIMQSAAARFHMHQSAPNPSKLAKHLAALPPSSPSAALLCRQVFFAPDGDMTAFGLSCTAFQDDPELTARLFELSKADPRRRNICALARKDGSLPLHDAVRGAPVTAPDVPIETIKLLVREFPEALGVRSTSDGALTPIEMARAKSPQQPDLVTFLAACTEAFSQQRFDAIAELCGENAA